jgi:hypothetical protein
MLTFLPSFRGSGQRLRVKREAHTQAEEKKEEERRKRATPKTLTAVEQRITGEHGNRGSWVIT